MSGLVFGITNEIDNPSAAQEISDEKIHCPDHTKVWMHNTIQRVLWDINK